MSGNVPEPRWFGALVSAGPCDLEDLPPRLWEAERGVQAKIPMMSARMLGWLRTAQGPSLGNVSRRLSGHFTLPRELLSLGAPGEGTLRRSAPVAPNTRPPSLCGQEGESGIRANL